MNLRARKFLRRSAITLLCLLALALLMWLAFRGWSVLLLAPAAALLAAAMSGEPLLARGLMSNRLILAGIATEILLIALIVYTPLGHALFGTASVSMAALSTGMRRRPPPSARARRDAPRRCGSPAP